jgi:signal transduction histidine kinase
MTSTRPIDAVADAALVVDGDGVVQQANGEAARLAGRPFHTDLVGLRCEDLLSGGDPHTGNGRFTGWHPSASLRSVTRLPEQPLDLHRPDGSSVRVLVTGRYTRDESGRVLAAFLSLRPADRRTHMNSSGVEIISTVSHELRSPLTSVKGYTSLLLNRWDRLKDEQKKMMLEQVNHDADRVTRLITELLDISRLETGRLVLRRQLVDLPALAATIVEKVRMIEPALEATTAFADGFPRVLADPDKVEQVLTNLVENAAKYASPAGLRIVGTFDDDHVDVAVIDRGPGIPADVVPRLFDKFFRAPDTKPTGTGLGLFISRGLVEAHGGRLTADSASHGSTFRFTLPRTVPEELT